jgi:hypothetical protein
MDGEQRCGMLLTSEYKNEKGETKTADQCAFVAMANELIAIKQALGAVQQATESHRNEETNVGIAVTQTLDKGFKKLARAAVLNKYPELAMIEEDD